MNEGTTKAARLRASEKQRRRISKAIEIVLTDTIEHQMVYSTFNNIFDIFSIRPIAAQNCYLTGVSARITNSTYHD